MKARVTAYAGVQLADYLTGRGIVAVLATALAAWGYGALNGLTISVFDPSAGIETREQLRRAIEVLLATFGLILAALSAQGLVARHRRRRYDRAIFANAISPLRYYVQGFVLAGFGGAMLAAALAQIVSVVVQPVSVPGVAAYAVLVWLTIGSLAFLLSSLTMWHTPLLVLLTGAGLALDRLSSAQRAAGQGNPSLDAVQYLLPPGHVLVTLSRRFAQGLVVEPQVLAWPVLFGVACLLAAVLLLRRRPFGT
ncbi:MAG TPA: hypothetical protein VM076_18995 [Gemmatimonadaceae bacterium]|nr:hypothetical protein [Gemmatimonadaceae bacterium]